MITIEKLYEKFGVKGEIDFEKRENDLIFLTVSNKYANAEVCLYGAHITSFRPHGSMDILWMSPASYFEAGKPVRGGIPVCFPWFGPHQTDPEKPQHGFGRLMFWELMEIMAEVNGETQVRLQLCSSEITKTYWPFEFCAELIMVVGKTLKVSLKVTNTSVSQFSYSCALHSYYNISDIRHIAIDGLSGTQYHNHLQPGEFFEESAKLEILQPETRHYHNTAAACIIEDPIFNRKIRAAKSGSKVTTVWNPGESACTAIADLPDDGFKYFICIEAVNSFEDLIILNPGQSHETSAIIGLEE